MPAHARVEVLTSLAEVEAVAPAWRALYRDAEDATLFQSPEWMLGCLRHCDRGEPRVVVVRAGERLVGVLPLTASSRECWTFAGTGPTDVLDLVAARADGAAAARAAFTELARRRDWQSLELHELRERSPVLEAARLAGPVTVDAPLSVCPTLPIPPGATTLEAIVPARWAKRVRREQRVCERAGLRVELARPDDALEHVRAWTRLHTARWARRGEPGVLRGRARFDVEVLPPLIASGEVELLSLRDAGGAIRASCVVFRERARAAYYLGGFDSEVARLSPLVVLIACAIRRAAEAGARELDFLRGAEPYKHRWGAIDRVQRRIRVERPA